MDKTIFRIGRKFTYRTDEIHTISGYSSTQKNVFITDNGNHTWMVAPHIHDDFEWLDEKYNNNTSTQDTITLIKELEEVRKHYDWYDLNKVINQSDIVDIDFKNQLYALNNAIKELLK